MRVHCSNSPTFAASEGAADGYGKQQIEYQVCAAAPLERLAYGIRDAAAVSSISRSKLYELIKSGALRSVKIAGRRSVTRAALLELLKSTKSMTNAQRQRAYRQRQRNANVTPPVPEHNAVTTDKIEGRRRAYPARTHPISSKGER